MLLSCSKKGWKFMEPIEDACYLSHQRGVDSLMDQESRVKDSYYKAITEQDLISGKITVACGESIKKIASIFLLIIPTISSLNPVSFIAVASATFFTNIAMSPSHQSKEPSYFERLQEEIRQVSKLTHKEKIKWLFLDVLINVSFKVAAFAIYKRFSAARSVIVFAVSSYYLSFFYQAALNQVDTLIQSYLDKKREQEYIGIIH